MTCTTPSNSRSCRAASAVNIFRVHSREHQPAVHHAGQRQRFEQLRRPGLARQLVPAGERPLGRHGRHDYRLHSYSDAEDQNNTTALNTFAFWATATGGSPRIYGLGAMEAYVRLPGGQASEFYLAQIDAVHAGKTMQIDLWDPGDTGVPSASLKISGSDRQRLCSRPPSGYKAAGEASSSSGVFELQRPGSGSWVSIGPVTTNTG